MRSKHKALILFLCVVLVVTATALGTFAYLTDQESATNTFTVGQVGLSLDEADVKTDGTYETNHDARVQNNEYHLLPGHTYYKDPTVTVDARSSDAYIRMIVAVENIDELKKALPGTQYYNEGIFLLETLCKGWDSDVWVYEGYSESTENGV